MCRNCVLHFLYLLALFFAFSLSLKSVRFRISSFSQQHTFSTLNTVNCFWYHVKGTNKSLIVVDKWQCALKVTWFTQPKKRKPDWIWIEDKTKREYVVVNWAHHVHLKNLWVLWTKNTTIRTILAYIQSERQTSSACYFCASLNSTANSFANIYIFSWWDFFHHAITHCYFLWHSLIWFSFMSVFMDFLCSQRVSFFFFGCCPLQSEFGLWSSVNGYWFLWLIDKSLMGYSYSISDGFLFIL